MTAVRSTDPRTGAAVATVGQETTSEEVGRLCRLAQAAARPLEEMGRGGRADLLRRLATALEARADEVVAVADRETALGTTRLEGELRRTCYQLRLFAEVLEEGSYLEAAVDHAGPTPMGPRPDLRRMLVPIGPVAVFGASNFPLAFSVPGGDTASALAAGCPVVVKAHASHPATSQLCFEVMASALSGAGAPQGALAIVHGREAGVALVAHPAVRAVGFTGSSSGGKALVDVINGRPDPIPFYGELSSLNPVVVTPTAAARRAEEVGRGLVASFTMGAGQFCTKPGLVLVPGGDGGDRLLAAAAEAVSDLPPYVLLNDRIADSYRETTSRLLKSADVRRVAHGAAADGTGWSVQALLLETDAADLAREVTEECFGPVSVVARYDGTSELMSALDRLPASLTTTIHASDDESEIPVLVARALADRTGRYVHDGWPTGVAVSWAQHHGGPWPATNTLHTSVGTSSLRRFLRPVCWQDAPAHLLPEELRDEATVPRRVDGRMVSP